MFLFLESGVWSILTTSGPTPSSRQGHVAAMVGNRLFVHGGMAGQEVLSDLHCLDLGEYGIKMLYTRHNLSSIMF